MANSITHPFCDPVYGCLFNVAVPYLDADGDPTDPITPDTEVSIDGGAFADCTNEVTTITGSNGAGYLTLTAAEMTGQCIVLAAKAASGPKTTLAIIHPRKYSGLVSGTAQAGAASTITLAAGTASSAISGLYSGCLIKLTGGTGVGQVRRITLYVGSTKVATIGPANWETTPDNTTTYEVMMTEQRPNYVVPANAIGVDQLADGAITAAKIATDAIDADALATDGITEIAAGVWNALTSGLVTASSIGKLLVDNVNATISSRSTLTAANVWDALTSGLSTVGSIGKLLVDNINATVGSRSSHSAADVKTAVEAGGSHLTLIKATTDQLADTVEDSGGGAYIFTEAALAQAPTGGGGGLVAQDVADALKLAPAAGAAAAGSVYALLGPVATMRLRVSELWRRLCGTVSANSATNVLAVPAEDDDPEFTLTEATVGTTTTVTRD